MSVDVEEDYAPRPEVAHQEALAAQERASRAVALMRPELWRELAWKPHELQETILMSTARNKVFAGGRRVGKSQTGGQQLLPYAFSALAELEWLERIGGRREYWIVGPEYSDAEKEFRVLHNALRRLKVPLDRPGTYYNPLQGEMHISLWSGKFQVHAKSAKYPQTLIGEGVSGIVLSEAAKLKPSVWPKYLRPTLTDFVGWAYFGSTPEGRNWFYRMWEAGQDPLKTDWASWRAPSWTNTHLFPLGATDEAIKELRSWIKKAHLPDRLPPVIAANSPVTPEMWENVIHRTWQKYGGALGIDPEVVSLMLDLSEELFNQEVAALFNEFVGRVFKDFDEELHVGDFNYEPSWATYACLDYGFTNPFVWLVVQVDPHGHYIRVLDEYYETGKTTEEAANEIRGRGLAPGSLLGFYPDPAEPDRSKQLSGLLQLRSFGDTGGPLADRLEWIRRKLKPHPLIAHLDPSHPEWRPQLQFSRRCPRTIGDMNKYRYPATYDEMSDLNRAAPEAPLKKDDHAPEALGRLMRGLFGSPWNATPVRQSTARLSRGRGRGSR